MEKASANVVEDLLVIKPSGEGSSNPPGESDKSKDLKGLAESKEGEEGAMDLEQPQHKSPEKPLAPTAVEELKAFSSGHEMEVVDPPPPENSPSSSPLKTVGVVGSRIELSSGISQTRTENAPEDPAKSDTLFPPGELVFARSEYYPHYWPGVIADPW